MKRRRQSSFIWLLIDLPLKITKIIFFPVIPSYPKQVWGKRNFYCDFIHEIYAHKALVSFHYNYYLFLAGFLG